jgi:outer membrane protein assembly factor BamB
MITVLLLLAAPLGADDWPQWRGPEGIGVSREEGLPTRWGPEEGVVWKVPLEGVGTSSPTVAGDRVFVTAQIGSGEVTEGGRESPEAVAARRTEGAKGVEFVVRAVHRHDGRSLWTRRFAAEGDIPPVQRKHNMASPTPVTDGERIYAWFGNGQLFAFNVADGEVVWKRHLGKEIAPFDIRWGHGSSPTLYKDLLYLLCDHPPGAYLLALDAKTGKERWRLDRGKGPRSYTTPLVVQGEDGDILIVNSSARVEALEPTTGKLIWHAGEPVRVPVATPVHHGGILYVSRGSRSGPYLALRLGGRGDVSETHVLWQVDTGAPYVGSLIHHEGLVFMATEQGIATAVDPKTGKRVWRQRLGGAFTSSPVAGDGKVYFTNEAGETVVVEAGSEGEVLARNTLGERVLASPAISDGQIFIRTDEHLVRIGE